MLLNHGVKIGMIAINPVIGMLDDYREPRKARINKQYRNKRNWCRGTKLYSWNGERLLAFEIYQKVKPNVSLKRFRKRLDHGWSVEKALAIPMRPTKRFFWNGDETPCPTSRFTAGAAGFFVLTQSREWPYFPFRDGLPKECPAYPGRRPMLSGIHPDGATHPPPDRAEMPQPLEVRCAFPPTQCAQQVATSWASRASRATPRELAATPVPSHLLSVCGPAAFPKAAAKLLAADKPDCSRGSRRSMCRLRS